MSGGRFYFLVTLVLVNGFILEAGEEYNEYKGFVPTVPSKDNFFPGHNGDNLPRTRTLDDIFQVGSLGDKSEGVTDLESGQSEESGVTDLKLSRFFDKDLKELTRDMLKKQDNLEKDFEAKYNLLRFQMQKYQEAVDKYQKTFEQNQNKIEVLIKFFNYGVNQLLEQLNDNNQKKSTKKIKKKPSFRSKKSHQNEQENDFIGKMKKTKSAPETHIINSIKNFEEDSQKDPNNNDNINLYDVYKLIYEISDKLDKMQQAINPMNNYQESNTTLKPKRQRSDNSLEKKKKNGKLFNQLLNNDSKNKVSSSKIERKKSKKKNDDN